MGKIASKVEQGDVVLLNLNPSKGREQNGIRPAVVVSSKAFHFSNMVIVCPLTTKIKDFFGDPILKPESTNGLTGVSEVLIGQIRSVSIERISKKIGIVTRRELAEIFEGFDLLCDRD